MDKSKVGQLANSIDINALFEDGIDLQADDLLSLQASVQGAVFSRKKNKTKPVKAMNDINQQLQQEISSFADKFVENDDLFFAEEKHQELEEELDPMEGYLADLLGLSKKLNCSTGLPQKEVMQQSEEVELSPGWMIDSDRVDFAQRCKQRMKRFKNHLKKVSKYSLKNEMALIDLD